MLSQQGGWYTVVDAKFYNMINDLASVDTGNQILWQEESRLTSTATEQMTSQLSILRNFINLSMTSLLFLNFRNKPKIYFNPTSSIVIKLY